RRTTELVNLLLQRSVSFAIGQEIAVEYQQLDFAISLQIVGQEPPALRSFAEVSTELIPPGKYDRGAHRCRPLRRERLRGKRLGLFRKLLEGDWRSAAARCVRLDGFDATNDLLAQFGRRLRPL